MATTRFSRVARKHATAAYRSGLEVKVAAQLDAAGVAYTYEQSKLDYTTPETPHKYTPDFVLGNGIVVETKGMLDLADRKKHLLVAAQYPGLDLRFVFTNSKAKLRKGSPTSYADWCEANGFWYADKLIPAEWLTESSP